MLESHCAKREDSPLKANSDSGLIKVINSVDKLARISI